MTVNYLSAEGFRNLEHIEIRPDAGVNIICGSNAQGKTNLVEAVWLMTGSRSFRGAKDNELVRIGGRRAILSMEFSASGRGQTIAMEIGEGRKAALGGVPLDSPLRLAGEFCAVIFSPEHLELIKEGPSPRRRFLDAAICQLRPGHAALLMEYRKLLLQRNALLKDLPSHSGLLDTLDVWTEHLCHTGARLVFTRERYLRKFSRKASEIYRNIASNGEEMQLTYKSADAGSIRELDSPSEACAGIEASLLSAMKALRGEDLRAGYTHAGPHRDDLEVTIAGLAARSYGSQGQQRTAVLALKLAEAEMLREGLGEPPVLLLDDVLSELDAHRQDYLLNHIEDQQVFITCCDPELRRRVTGGGFYRVEAGRIESIGTGLC